MKQLDLRGQVALVTGGAGAMGGALGHVLEQAGATVAAAVAAGMAGDRAVIAPGRARVVWGLARHAPRLASRVIASNVGKELRRRP